MKRFLFALGLVLLAARADAAVAFDAKATANSTGASGTSVNKADMTVGVGSNRALIVIVALVDPTGLSVTWDSGGTNQAMSLIPNTSVTNGAAGNLQLWGVVNPISGNKTLRIAWTNSSAFNIDAVAFTGVDQTGGATSFPNGTTNTAATGGGPFTQTLTITSANGNAAVGGYVSAASYSAVDNQSIWFDNTNNSAAGNYKLSTSSSSVLTATFNPNINPAASGCDILAGGGATPRFRSLLGVGL